MERRELRLLAREPAGPLGTFSDDDLMVLLRAGDERALAKLIERHGALVVGFAAKFLGDAGLAQDVAQETFLSLWSERDRYEGRGHFKNYVLSVAYNRCREAARRRNRAKDVVLRLRALDVDEPEPTQMDALLKRATCERVQAALDGLPEVMRRDLILRFQCGLSYEEIAHVTGRATGSAKANVSRGLQKLRDRLVGEATL